MPTRRHFLTKVAALTVPTLIPSEVLAKPPRRKGAGDTVRLGFIGVGRRGKQLLEAMPEGAKVVAVCNVYKPRAEAVGSQYNAKVFHDFCRVLDRKNVDAVVIATPDHWHALPAVLACQAGAIDLESGRREVQGQRAGERASRHGAEEGLRVAGGVKPMRRQCSMHFQSNKVRGGAGGFFVSERNGAPYVRISNCPALCQQGLLRLVLQYRYPACLNVGLDPCQ